MRSAFNSSSVSSLLDECFKYLAMAGKIPSTESCASFKNFFLSFSPDAKYSNWGQTWATSKANYLSKMGKKYLIVVSGVSW